MYDRDEVVIIEKIERLLELYTIEELLEMMDLDLSDAVYLLWKGGYVELPEVTPCE